MSVPYEPEKDPVHMLFKRAMETAGPKRMDGHSFHLRVKKGDAEIDFTTEPPQTTQVYRRESSQQRSTTKAEAESILSGYKEYIRVEETADKIIARKLKNIPEDVWGNLGKVLASNGFKWSSGAAVWEASKK